MKCAIYNKDISTNSTYHNASNEVPRFPSVTNDVPEDYREFCPGDFDSMLTYLKIVVTITPPFLIKSADQLGVPISTIFLCYMHTEQGRKFFANPVIIEIMHNIVNGTYVEHKFHNYALYVDISAQQKV